MSILKDILKRMGKGFEHAYSGENMSLKQKEKYLNNSSVYAKPVNVEAITFEASNGSNRRHVALFLGSELPAALMDYVIQTCTTLKHELTVITFQTEKTARNLLKLYEKNMQDAGIELTLVALTGDPISRLTRYLKGHPEIAFLACKDTGYIGHRYINGPKDKNLLPIPVVVVESKDGKEAKQLETNTNVVGNSETKIA